MINQYLPCMFQQIESEQPIKVEQLDYKKAAELRKHN